MVVSLLAFTAGSAAAAVFPVGLLWTAGAERPQNEEWANSSCQTPSRVQQVTSPVARGTHSYRLEVRDGDDVFGERCELGMGNPWAPPFPLFREGDERWISFQVYLPDDYPIHTPDWNVFFQIHQQGDMGSPAVALQVVDGQFRLYNSTVNTYVLDTLERWHAPARRNTWAKFTLHILFSPDNSVGYVEIYGDLDGQGERLLMPRQYMHTMTTDSSGQAPPEHARIGMYRDPAIQGTTHILFDGFTIAASQAAAETSAFGLTAPAL